MFTDLIKSQQIIKHSTWNFAGQISAIKIRVATRHRNSSYLKKSHPKSPKNLRVWIFKKFSNHGGNFHIHHCYLNTEIAWYWWKVGIELSLNRETLLKLTKYLFSIMCWFLNLMVFLAHSKMEKFVGICRKIFEKVGKSRKYSERGGWEGGP